MPEAKHYLQHAHVEKHGRAYVTLWDSVDDLLLDASNENVDKEWNQGGSSGEECTRASRRVSTSKWHGTPTFREAELLARNGWPEGRTQAVGLADILEGKIGAKLSPVFIDIMSHVGHRPSVPHYLAGEPEHYHRFTVDEKQVVGRVVRIFVDCGGNAGTKVNVFIARSAAVIALIETIQRQGDQVELHTGHLVHKNSNYLVQSTIVQRAGFHLDPDAIAFMCGHPSVLRRMYFAVNESMPKTFRHKMGCVPGGGYGRSVHERTMAKRLIDEHLVPLTGEFDLAIGSLDEGCSTKHGNGSWVSVDDRVDWIKDQMERLGYTMNEED